MKVIEKIHMLTPDERRAFCERDNYGAWYEHDKGWFIAWMDKDGSYVGPFDTQLEAVVEHDRINQDGGLTRTKVFHFFTAWGWQMIADNPGLTLEAMLADGRYFTRGAYWRIERQMQTEAERRE
jgi:hypothetical protein